MSIVYDSREEIMKKENAITCVMLLFFNLLTILLLNNSNSPHVSPKLASWVTGFVTGSSIMKLFNEV